MVKNVKKYKYISFDMFDTLVVRNVNNYKIVFKLLEKEYENYKKISNSSFYDMRLKAEGIAREKTNKESVTFQEIYEYMNLDDEDKKFLMEKEYEIEKSLIVANPQMKKIYDYYVKLDKKIIVISDMYYSKEQLLSILKKCGYENIYNIYVSCEFNKCKHTGNLFEHVKKDLGIKAKQLIHFGDAKKGDWIIPKLKGIKSRLVTNKLKLKYSNYDETALNWDAFINNSINKYEEKNFYWQYGYEVFGKIVYGFCSWLKNNLQNSDTKKIYFLARDGYLLKKVYELINDNKNIEPRYLYISRRSVSVPLICECSSFEDVINEIGLNSNFTIKEFLFKLGLKESKYIYAMNKYKLDINTIVKKDDLLNNENFAKFYHEIEPDVIKNSKKENLIIKQYLKQENVSGDIAFIDLGWNCTIQKNVQRLIPQANITGYYFGTVNSEKVSTKGYLFENDQSKQHFIWSCCGLFETMFLATEGSVEKYTKINDKVIPILFDYEQINKCDALLDIQEGAIQFVKDILNSSYINKINNIEYNMDSFKKFANDPSLGDIKKFGNIMFFDGKEKPMIKKSCIFRYLSINNLKKDFIESPWRIGQLKQMIKLNINYNKLYRNIYKKFK